MVRTDCLQTAVQLFVPFEARPNPIENTDLAYYDATRPRSGEAGRLPLQTDYAAIKNDSRNQESSATTSVQATPQDKIKAAKPPFNQVMAL